MPTSTKAGLLAVLATVLAAPLAPAQEPTIRQSLRVPGDQVTYKDLGGPQIGTVWGDPATGPHGSFLRLPKGFVSPVHLHSGDYYGVVVTGTVTNAEAGQREVPLGPGSYYFQKANTDHVTKCLGTADCLIYISQFSAFDFITSRK